MSHFQPIFQHRSAPVRVRFGPGIRNDIVDELERLGCKHAFVLATPTHADSAMEIAETANGHAAGVFTKAAMHTPVEITKEAVDHARDVEADCLIAIGGGSTTGLGKAIALQTDLPQIVIPTTYAGSEATPILGQTEGGVKSTLTDPRVRPEVILYDAELVVTLPINMTVNSGLNAMAHAVEALYAKDRNPVSTVMAVEGLRAFTEGLPKVVSEPEDIDARGETLYGAWLCGTVLGQVGMALHHKLCHTLGGSFGLPHAETHAVVLPHVTAFNENAASEELAPLREIFGSQNAGQALFDFATELGAPTQLSELGFGEKQIKKAAKYAVRNPYWNPQTFAHADIEILLANAVAGFRPQ